MKQVAIAALLAWGLFSSTAYGTSQAVPSRLVGVWTIPGGASITTKSSGRATFRLTGYSEVMTVSGTAARVSFGPATVCAGKGTYSWKRAGRLLTFKPVKDACLECRAFVSGTWKKR